MEIFRILTGCGISIVHYKTKGGSASHLDNFNDFPKNVMPDQALLVNDFEVAGFENVSLVECENYMDGLPEWYVRGIKPNR